MYGAIIGDIIGSKYEFNNYRGKSFPLFTEDMAITDDTIMTLAVAEAIQFNENIDELPKEATIEMKYFGWKYPRASYGSYFRWWLNHNEKDFSYNSYGNGAAMRVSYCGEVGKTMDDVKRLSYEVTRTSHDHYEGIKGAEAVACCVWVAKNCPNKLEETMLSYYPEVANMSIRELRKTYFFNETCQGTIPQAFRCVLESKDFEDLVRNCISIGGDSDTLACIACSIGEYLFGIPQEFKKKAREYMPQDLLDILDTPLKQYSVSSHTSRVKKDRMRIYYEFPD